METLERCLEICELDPAHFLSAQELASQATLKKTKVKLDLLIDFDMLIMVGKSIGGSGIYHATHQYAEANDKYMEN